MNERDRHYLRHILEDAVLRNIEIIGEAAKSLSEKLKAASPATPWRQIGRMRDKLIHHYFGVDLDLIWEVVARDVPALRQEVEAILAEPDPPGREEP